MTDELLFLTDVGLCRQPQGRPLIPAAEEGGGVLDAMSIEFLHRTGACVLVLSSTVGDDHALRRNLLEPLDELTLRDADRTFDVAGVVRLFRTHVDEDGLLFFDELLGFVARDALRFVLSLIRLLRRRDDQIRIRRLRRNHDLLRTCRIRKREESRYGSESTHSVSFATRVF